MVEKQSQFDKPHSQHFYSADEDFQFETVSTMKWYQRFDEASARLDEEETGLTDEPVRITCRTEEPAPMQERGPPPLAAPRSTPEHVRGKRCRRLTTKTAACTVPTSRC